MQRHARGRLARNEATARREENSVEGSFFARHWAGGWDARKLALELALHGIAAPPGGGGEGTGGAGGAGDRAGAWARALEAERPRPVVGWRMVRLVFGHPAAPGDGGAGDAAAAARRAANAAVLRRLVPSTMMQKKLRRMFEDGCTCTEEVGGVWTEASIDADAYAAKREELKAKAKAKKKAR